MTQPAEPAPTTTKSASSASCWPDMAFPLVSLFDRGARLRGRRLRPQVPVGKVAATGPGGGGERAGAIGPVRHVAALHMLTQRRSHRIGQARHELSGTAFAGGEWLPVVLETGELHANGDAGLLHVAQAEPAPQRGHLVGCAQRTEQRSRRRGGRIERGGGIPHQSLMGHAAERVPHRGRDRPAGPHDAAHLGDRVVCVGNELQHQHRVRPIE